MFLQGKINITLGCAEWCLAHKKHQLILLICAMLSRKLQEHVQKKKKQMRKKKPKPNPNTQEISTPVRTIRPRKPDL